MVDPRRPRSGWAARGHALVGAGGLWLASIAAGGVGTALAPRLVELARAAGRSQVDGLVELGIVAVGVAVLVWLAVSCGVAAGCLTARAAGGGWRRGEAWVHRWAPAVVRRAVVLAVGAGLGLSAATGASAVDVPVSTPAPSVSSTTVRTGAAADLGWVPTEQSAAPSSTPATPPPTAGSVAPRSDAAAPSGSPTVSVPAVSPTSPAVSTTTATDQSAAHGRSATTVPVSRPEALHESAPVGTAASSTVPARAATAATVTVAPGDTLWAIAARHLPAGADDAQIAAAWPAWYAANAAAIGSDPDMVHPGQLLTVPAGVDGVAS